MWVLDTALRIWVEFYQFCKFHSDFTHFTPQFKGLVSFMALHRQLDPFRRWLSGFFVTFNRGMASFKGIGVKTHSFWESNKSFWRELSRHWFNTSFNVKQSRKILNPASWMHHLEFAVNWAWRLENQPGNIFPVNSRTDSSILPFPHQTILLVKAKDICKYIVFYATHGFNLDNVNVVYFSRSLSGTLSRTLFRNMGGLEGSPARHFMIVRLSINHLGDMPREWAHEKRLVFEAVTYMYDEPSLGTITSPCNMPWHFLSRWSSSLHY